MAEVDEITEKALRLQAECHEHIDRIRGQKQYRSLSRQDLTNIWIFKKLAQYEVWFQALTQMNNGTTNP